MTEYHVNLPEGMVLTVEIEDTPIKLHLTFKDGHRATFDYIGTPSRKAFYVPSLVPKPVGPPATHPRKGNSVSNPLPPLARTAVVGASPAERIEFIDPQGSEM